MKKQVKKPNFIDIILILIIVAIALCAYFLSHDTAPSAGTIAASYIIELTDPQGLTADFIKTGSAVTDKAKGYDMGTVTAVDSTSSALRITVETDAIESENGISTASGCSIRVGTLVWCSIDEISVTGTIVGLSF